MITSKVGDLPALAVYEPTSLYVLPATSFDPARDRSQHHMGSLLDGPRLATVGVPGLLTVVPAVRL